MFDINALLGPIGQKYPWSIPVITVIALMAIFLICYKAGKSIGQLIYYLMNP